MTFSLHADRQLVPAGSESVRFVVVRIVAPARRVGQPRPRAHVAFCIDRSASMVGRKILEAQVAVTVGLRRLEEGDRFSIVAYDGGVDVLAAGVDAGPTGCAEAIRRVQAIQLGRATDLAGGWLRAAGCLLDRPRRAEVARCLLLTDGQANRGVIDPSLLAHHAGALRARGVSTSAFGIGHGFDEAVLGGIADAGGGTFRFVDSADRIVPLVQDELGEALDVVARDVALEVAVPDGVVVGALGPYRVTTRGSVVRIDLPDLVARQELEVVLHVELPARPAGERVSVSVRAGSLGGPPRATHFRYAAGPVSGGSPCDRDVIRLVAHRLAGAARERAALANRDAAGERAAEELREAARRIRAYAGEDASLEPLLVQLEVEAEAVRQRLGESERKSMFAVASSVVRSKRPDGGSWRP